MSKSKTRFIDVWSENDLYQHLEALKRSREKRREYQEIFVEGVASINALVQTGHAITSIAFSREQTLSAWAKGIIANADPIRVYRLTADLMGKLSDRSDPSELIVTAQFAERTLADVAVHPNLWIVVFERPSNPGNLGSLVRTCDAFGVDAVVTTGHSVDIYDPAAIRASLGAIFHMPIIHVPSPIPLEQWVAQVRQALPNLRLVGTDAQAPLAAFDLKVTPPLILVLGNEARGMGKRLEQLVDTTVSIPMQGHVDSLNVACAGSILLYQIKQNVWMHKGATT